MDLRQGHQAGQGRQPRARQQQEPRQEWPPGAGAGYRRRRDQLLPRRGPADPDLRQPRDRGPGRHRRAVGLRPAVAVQDLHRVRVRLREQREQGLHPRRSQQHRQGHHPGWHRRALPGQLVQGLRQPRVLRRLGHGHLAGHEPLQHVRRRRQARRLRDQRLPLEHLQRHQHERLPLRHRPDQPRHALHLRGQRLQRVQRQGPLLRLQRHDVAHRHLGSGELADQLLPVRSRQHELHALRRHQAAERRAAAGLDRRLRRPQLRLWRQRRHAQRRPLPLGHAQRHRQRPVREQQGHR